MKQRCKIMVMLFVLVVGLPDTAAARDLQAVLDWAEQHVVCFEVNGLVEKVHVRAGERVSRGARLIELDTEPFEISFGQFEASVAAREPVLAEAKREYDQAGSLYEQTVLSDVELQRTQHAFEQARAELAQSKAALQLARWRLDRTRVLAPWGAWVIQRNVEPGQVLVDDQRSAPLLVLARDDIMTARAMLPAAAIQTLRIGQKVSVLIDGSRHDAEIISVGMQPETADGEPLYRLEARFSTVPDEGLRAGQSAVVQLQ